MSLLLNLALFLRDSDHSNKFTLQEKVILYTLAGHVGKNQDWIIKQSDLMIECDLPPSTFKRHLKSLLRKKIISIHKVVTKTGRQSCYHFCPIIVDYSPLADCSQKTTTAHQRDVVGGGTAHQRAVGIAHQRDVVPPVDNPPDPMALSVQGDAISSKETYKRNTKSNITTKASAFALPAWLPQQEFDDFLEHRKSLKAPMSLIAQKRAISSLTKLRETGQNISDVLDQSIVNGWKGMFPVRKTFDNQAAHLNASAQRVNTVIQNIWSN